MTVISAARHSIQFSEESPLDAFELTKQQRTAAISSMQRYFEENLEPIGDLPAGLLLNFFLEEIGPDLYNQAISDAQTRLRAARSRP